MASKLYKKNEDGEIIEESVNAEYVYALLQDGWVGSLDELETKKKLFSKKAPEKKEPIVEAKDDD